MVTNTNTEFAKRMMLMSRPYEQFVPTATYDPDGDCIEFLYKPDSFYAERIDDLVTVYYSNETDEVIGSLIKDVSKFCSAILSRMPRFGIEINDGKGIVLQHIFLASMWSKDNELEEIEMLTYKKLIEISDETIVEGDLCLAY